MFPHRNIHKYKWTSPDRNIYNQFHHILIDRWHPRLLDVRFFKRIFKNSVTEIQGPYDLKQHKHRFDEDQRKQVQMQWLHHYVITLLHHPNKTIYIIRTMQGGKLFDISGKNEGISESWNWWIETNSKIKNTGDWYRGINDFKKSYQTRTNIVKDEKRDFVADSYSILARWRNNSYKLFNVHGYYDVRHI